MIGTNLPRPCEDFPARPRADREPEPGTAPLGGCLAACFGPC